MSTTDQINEEKHKTEADDNADNVADDSSSCNLHSDFEFISLLDDDGALDNNNIGGDFTVWVKKESEENGQDGGFENELSAQYTNNKPSLRNGQQQQQMSSNCGDDLLQQQMQHNLQIKKVQASVNMHLAALQTDFQSRLEALRTEIDSQLEQLKVGSEQNCDGQNISQIINSIANDTGSITVEAEEMLTSENRQEQQQQQQLIPVRKRVNLLTGYQLDRLVEVFQKKCYLSLAERACLAQELGLSEWHVKIWFQYQRYYKKKPMEREDLSQEKEHHQQQKQQPLLVPLEHRKKNATREVTAPLKHWLDEHCENPYPTKEQRTVLACTTELTLTQVSTWFANARRRLYLEKNANNKMTPGHEDKKESTDAEMPDQHQQHLARDEYDDKTVETEEEQNRTNTTADGKADNKLQLGQEGGKRRVISDEEKKCEEILCKNMAKQAIMWSKVSEEICNKIVDLARDGMPPCHISRQLQVSKSSVNMILEHHYETGKIKSPAAPISDKSELRVTAKKICEKIKEYKDQQSSMFDWEIRDRLREDKQVCIYETTLPSVSSINRVLRYLQASKQKEQTINLAANGVQQLKQLEHQDSNNDNCIGKDGKSGEEEILYENMDDEAKQKLLNDLLTRCKQAKSPEEREAIFTGLRTKPLLFNALLKTTVRKEHKK